MSESRRFETGQSAHIFLVLMLNLRNELSFRYQLSLISDSCDAAVTSIDSDLYILFELSLVLNSFKALLII